MRFTAKNTSGGHIENLMKMAQYHFMGFASNDGKMNFIHPLGGDNYPRFHIYLRYDKKNKEMSIDLHLDQKKPIYQGATAHQGEYEGEIIEKEAARIKKALTKETF